MIRLKTFVNAFKGIATAVKNERNLRLHLIAAVLVVVVGLYFSITTTEWIIVLLLIALVISLELINTAIEYLVDLVSPQYHEKAGKIKDIAAGAVLVVAIVSVVIAVLIFWKYVEAWITG